MENFSSLETGHLREVIATRSLTVSRIKLTLKEEGLVTTDCFLESRHVQELRMALDQIITNTSSMKLLSLELVPYIVQLIKVVLTF